MREKKKNLLASVLLIILSISVLGVTCEMRIFSKDDANDKKVTETKSKLKRQDTLKTDPSKQIITIKLENLQSVDDAALNEQVEDYVRDIYPIISDETIEQIQTSKTIDKKLINDTLGIVEFYLSFPVPKNYLEEHPKILWELNIPEFSSRIYQLFNGDTLLIDTWPNVVGKPSTKTYTGHYSAFRIRNWPSWKDPESGDSVRPTPPGPNNPLGLFVVHYDENSLRYFHGTNKNYLLKNEYRALSHGCVRNDNGNIRKMKEFLLKKVIVSRDLTSWIDSKKSMTYEFGEEDKFPVRIIYRTFDINKNSNGEYIEFFKDVYGYAKGAKWSKFDEEELMTFTTEENMLAYYKLKHPTNRIPDEKLIPILEKLIASHNDYEKYYLSDLLAGTN